MSLLRRLYHKALRPVLTRGYAFLTYRTFDQAFGQAVRDWQPDVIHAHDGVTLPAAARAAKDIGAKLIFDSHELELHRSPPLSRMRKWQVKRTERAFLPRADRVMTVTERAADYLAGEYAIPRPTVVFNAPPRVVEQVPPRWEVPNRVDIRWDASIHPREFVFAYTGNVTLNRGLEIVIIALSRLQGFVASHGQYRTRYHLVTVGKTQSDQDTALKRLAKTYGVSSELHLLPPVAPHRVAQYIATANASIIPIMPVTLSYEYAMPNKLFEAMLSGNPIIASDLVEMGPFVRDNGLGVTFDPESIDDCLAKMVELIEQPARFRRSSERQAELASRFAWEAQERTLLAMYDQMLAERDG